jgi:hypothetical protein
MKQKNIRFNSKHLSTALFLLLFLQNFNPFAAAQPNTLYFFNKVHQSNYLNPATQNACGGYYMLPAISALSVNAINSGFTFNDVFKKGTGNMADSLVIDIIGLKSKIGDANYVMTDVVVPLLGFGFWSGASNFNFEINHKTNVKLAYPKSLIALSGGNQDFIGENNPLSINRFGPDAMSYYEISLGWSRKITHRLTIGSKLKVLSGLSAIQKKNSDLKIVTADTTYAMRLETDLNYNISAPIKFTYDEQGLISDFDYDQNNLVKDLLPNKNFGIAADLGAIYQFNDRLKFYASITDLGFIHWNKNGSFLAHKDNFEFSGLTFDSIWTDSDYDEFEALADSLKDFFKFKNGNVRFTTTLSANLFLGATYEIAHFFNMGIVSRTRFFDNKIHPELTLSANLSPGKRFATSLSYSIMNRQYSNFGIAMAYKLGAFQFYVVTDNFYNALVPKNAKSAGFLFGINWVFGCNKRNNFTILQNSNPGKEIDFL